MRDRFILIMALIFGYSAQAQYNNDWIQYDQTYLKFSYNRSGIFRLYKKDLEKLPEANNNPERIQIFNKGKEVAAYAFGLQDNRFDEGDYLEFYLKVNQGEQDQILYYPQTAKPQVTSGIYGNETYIFVTIGKNAGMRQKLDSFRHTDVTEDYHITHELIHLTDSWSFNNNSDPIPLLQQSYYERGESWTGPMITNGNIRTRIFTLKNYLPKDEHEIKFTPLIYTRSNITHGITVKVNDRTIGNMRNYGFDHQEFPTKILTSDLNSSNSFTFSTSSTIPNDIYSWTQFSLRYPQKIDLKGVDSLTLYLPNSATSTSNIKLLNAHQNYIAYDISSRFEAKRIPTKADLIFVNNRQYTSKIYVDINTQTFGNPEVILFKRLSTSANYLIITHQTLWSSAEAYRAYRSSPEGGNYSVELIDVHDIYNQFNFGERSSAAIKHYLSYQLQNSKPSERYILLIGKPVSFPTTLQPEASQDLVPAVGYPGSDVFLSAGLGGLHIDLPAYLTGRIAARSNDEVFNYLKKVKEYESNSIGQTWKKNAIHLNGGNNISELSSFKNFMASLKTRGENSKSNLKIETLSKQSTEPTENVNISSYVNEGLGFISYFGHGSSSILDFNIGFVSDPTLGFNNKGKYPFMYFNGCGVGNVFHRYSPLSADWLFSPDKGAIGVLANSYWAYTTSSMAFLNLFYDKLFNDPNTMGQPISKVILEAVKERLADPSYNQYDQSNSHQMILQGDPAVVVNPFQKADYTWKKNSVQISSTNAGSSIGTSSQIVVSAEIQNLGKIEENQAIPVKAVVQYLNGTSESIGLRKITRSFQNSYSDTLHITQPIRNITLILNPDSNIPELTFENNIENIEVDWDQAKNVSIYPYRPELDKTNPTLLAFINDQLTTEGKYTKAPKITFKIQDENPLPIQIAGIRIYIKTNNQFTEIPRGLYTLTQNSANQITGTFVSPEQIGNYELLINATDAAGNLAGQDLYLKWEIVENLRPSIIVAPNPVQERIKLLINSVGQDQVALQLYDLKGKEVFKSTFLVNDGLNTIYLDFSPKQGTYTYVGTLNLKKITGKIIVE